MKEDELNLPCNRYLLQRGQGNLMRTEGDMIVSYLPLRQLKGSIRAQCSSHISRFPVVPTTTAFASFALQEEHLRLDTP